MNPNNRVNENPERKYVIARTRAEYPAVADTYTVVYQERENISHHESVADARVAIKRYQEADARRARADTGQSVQCPHCKWGFFPSVIDQHIREKHS